MKKETKSIGIQTDLTIEKEETEDVREQIEAGKHFEGLAKILDKEWQEKDYQTVHKTVGNPLKNNLRNDVAIFVDPNETGDRGIVKELTERYPERNKIYYRRRIRRRENPIHCRPDHNKPKKR